MLGGSVFADTSGDKVHLIWLKFLEDFDTAREYSWGFAALAWLYRQLYNAAKTKTKDICGQGQSCVFFFFNFIGKFFFFFNSLIPSSV